MQEKNEENINISEESDNENFEEFLGDLGEFEGKNYAIYYPFHEERRDVKFMIDKALNEFDLTNDRFVDLINIIIQNDAVYLFEELLKKLPDFYKKYEDITGLSFIGQVAKEQRFYIFYQILLLYPYIALEEDYKKNKETQNHLFSSFLPSNFIKENEKFFRKNKKGWAYSK